MLRAARASARAQLREEVDEGTPIGQQVQDIMARGELVSSELIVTLLRRRMRRFGQRRLLLDGFPRSLQNAIDFEAQCGKPELALLLHCPEETMIERILKRSAQLGRTDDNLETARRRCAVYREQGKPTMEWLRDSGVPIIRLDCSGTPDDVWAQLVVVGRLMRNATLIDQ